MRIDGTIKRRLLVNFVADPAVVAKLLPKPFRPQLFQGKAVVGICLIGFQGLRPHGVPEFLGITSENAAHRIAVEWESEEGVKTGVYIVRRDSNSYLKTLLGGRLFSGVHYYADFKTVDELPRMLVQFESRDGVTQVHVQGSVSTNWPQNSLFKNLETSSAFFQKGAVGYSPGHSGESTGMKLFMDKWVVEPFEIERVESSFFFDEKIFPKNSIQLDHALIMRDLKHYWMSVPTL